MTLLFLLAGAGFEHPLFAQKTDTVTLLNGDTITGEIKELELGLLRYSTDAAGTIRIEWPEVASISTDKLLEISLSSRVRLFGALEPVEDGTVAIVQPGQRVEVPLASVVGIAAIKSSFWDRMDGLISFGLAVEKANSLTSITGDFDTYYRARSFEINLDGQLFRQTRSDVEPTNRYNFGLSGTWRFADRWGLAGLVRLESSDEIDLKLRTTYGVGFRRLVSETNRIRLLLFTGLGGNSERFAGDDGVTS
ncbi:MAG: DUF481 domain-containing protein, partial [Gemmatimonadota bacterium]|nr:DUF481 domain-containing protein [Gemmatimonadota bacterium]